MEKTCEENDVKKAYKKVSLRIRSEELDRKLMKPLITAGISVTSGQKVSYAITLLLRHTDRGSAARQERTKLSKVCSDARHMQRRY